MGASHGVEYILNRRDSPCGCPTKAPSDEGAFVSSNLKIYATVGTGLAPVRNPQKLVATASRREGVYNRTGEPSVIFAEKEELHSE